MLGATGHLWFQAQPFRYPRCSLPQRALAGEAAFNKFRSLLDARHPRSPTRHGTKNRASPAKSGPHQRGCDETSRVQHINAKGSRCSKKAFGQMFTDGITQEGRLAPGERRQCGLSKPFKRRIVNARGLKRKLCQRRGRGIEDVHRAEQGVPRQPHESTRLPFRRDGARRRLGRFQFANEVSKTRHYGPFFGLNIFSIMLTISSTTSMFSESLASLRSVIKSLNDSRFFSDRRSKFFLKVA